MTASTLPRSGSAGFVVGLAGLVVTAAFVVWQLMSQGHAAYNASSAGLMWGLPIVTYDFFLMTSTGLAIVASMWTVFGWRAFEPIARRALWLAFAMMVGGLLALMLELGHPLRAMYAIPLNFQVKAPLFWKVPAVGIYGLCLVAMAAGWLAKPAGEVRPGRGVAVLGTLAALAVVLTGSLMFAAIPTRPLWHSGEVPAMVLVEAVLGGLAFAVLFSGGAAGAGSPESSASTVVLPRVMAGLILLALVFVAGRATVGLSSNLDGMQAWQAIVSGAGFWVQVVGLLLALWLTASGSARTGGGGGQLAAALVIVALFIGRYEFVIGGQLVPLFKGSWVHGLIAYSPSITEWILLVASAFLTYAVYAYGAARFRLGAAS
jgi:molybdopterin-containing oxidoreductase family membrane subunit